MSNLHLSCVWTLRVRDHATGLLVAERRTKNVWTSYGLTGLAGGQWNPNNMYLSVDAFYATMSTQASPGDASITLSQAVDYAGDANIVLSPGLAAQETVPFSGKTPNPDGSITYALASPCANTHPVGDPAVRKVSFSDTTTNILSEQQYDSVNFPNQRMQSPTGYSSGAGNFTIQFYYPGPTLQTYVMTCGMVDNITIGSGNLWNHFILGYNHNSTANDLEIDGVLTIANA